MSSYASRHYAGSQDCGLDAEKAAQLLSQRGRTLLQLLTGRELGRPSVWFAA
jgi:hypothetical protein